MKTKEKNTAYFVFAIISCVLCGLYLIINLWSIIVGLQQYVAQGYTLGAVLWALLPQWVPQLLTPLATFGIGAVLLFGINTLIKNTRTTAVFSESPEIQPSAPTVVPLKTEETSITEEVNREEADSEESDQTETVHEEINEETMQGDSEDTSMNEEEKDNSAE